MPRPLDPETARMVKELTATVTAAERFSDLLTRLGWQHEAQTVAGIRTELVRTLFSLRASA